jgi:hypothetical protein
MDRFVLKVCSIDLMLSPFSFEIFQIFLNCFQSIVEKNSKTLIESEEIYIGLILLEQLLYLLNSETQYY